MNTAFVRTKSTRGAKPKTDGTAELLRRRAIRRKSYHKNKEKHKKAKLEAQSIEFLPRPQEAEQVKPTRIKKRESPQPKPMQELSSAAESRSFRLFARRVSLTYSRVQDDVTLEDFLESLRSKPQLLGSDILLCKEPHTSTHNTNNTHFHVLAIRSHKKINVTNARFLDVEVNGCVYQGHYKSGQNDVPAALKYIKKGSEYISTNDPFFEELAGSSYNSSEVLEAVSQGAFSASQALHYIAENPKAALGKSTNAIKALDTSSRVNRIKQTLPAVPSSPHSLEDFEISPRLQEWIDSPDLLKYPLLLVGRSGAGKTRFVKALAQAKNWKTVIINVKDGMNAIQREHQLIVFDDYNFKESAEELLSLFTREPNERTQHKIIYQVVEIAGDQFSIFTMNHSMLYKLYPFLQEERFSRRIQIEEVADRFLKSSATTLNIYVQNNNNVNNVNNVYNLSEMDKERIARNKATLDNIVKNYKS